jgi:hypothetical protein
MIVDCMKICTRQELSSRLDLSKGEFDRLLDAGLPYVDLAGGTKVFIIESVVQWMRDHEIQKCAEAERPGKER